MPASTPAHDSSTPPRRKLPLLARHAISLGVVFVLALPLSYVGLRYYIQQQKLAQLDQQVDAEFNAGLAYIYAHAAVREAVAHRATDRIATLPTDRAVELHRVLLRAFVDEGKAVPRPVVDAGIALMNRVEMPEAVMVYRHTADAGIDGEDPALLAALNRHFAVESPSRFLQLVEFYDSHAMWSRAKVPAEAWLRWLVTLSHSPAETTQRQTARRLGELPEQADAPEIKEALIRLSQSEHPHVRAQVLKSIAGYAKIADDPTDYEQILFTLGEDENKVIARRAWLAVGHLNPYSGFSPDWQTADPYVAEAILWAAVKTNPDELNPVLNALGQPNYRAAALLVLPNRTGASLAHEAIVNAWRSTYQDNVPQSADAIAFWRGLLSIHASIGELGQFEDEVAKGLVAFEADVARTSSDAVEALPMDSLKLAAIYRVGELDSNVSLEGLTQLVSELAFIEGLAYAPRGVWRPSLAINDFPALCALALGIYESDIYEGIFSESNLFPFRTLDFKNVSIRNIGILAAAKAHPGVAQTLLTSGRTDLQLLACLASAIDSKPVHFIQGITADFLRTYPDITDDELHAMSDEQLAKIGLRRVDAVKILLEIADNHPEPAERYETVSLLKLALWIRGDLGDEFTATAEGMLLDPRLPTSTVLLALLHKQRPIALEYLFGDLVQPTPDLHKLFIQERFWHVFRRFVKTDDLDLWLWGDPAAQDFQLEAMRQWYWVNRFRISDFWISD